MEHIQSEREFNVLGFKLRLNPEDIEQSGDIVSPKEVVDLVTKEAHKIKNKNPRLESAELSVLVALRLARKLLNLKNDCEEDITSLQNFTVEALNTIKDIRPEGEHS